MNWNDLRHILTIARQGTLSAAARRLGVDQTTVARRLAAAEARLGARLFDRVDGTMRPTQAGETALRHAERVEAEIGLLEGAVGGVDAVPTGTVRLSSVPILVNHVLMPQLPTLLGRHPGLRLELAGEARNVSLSRREADIALRQARPQGGTAMSRRVGDLDYAVYGPARKRHDALPWVTYEDALADLPQARWIAAHARPDELAPVRVNDADAALAAVRAGLGKSLLPITAARGEPELRPLNGGAAVLSRELWLMVHPELRRLARIEAVIGWIEQVVAAP
jgi:DNA-binding transcriptional LysR family regulator